MVLTKEQQNAVIAFLDKKWGTTPGCPMCRGHKWNVSDRVFEMREFSGGNLVLGGGTSICPVIPITCANCGNIVFVNAISAGIVQANPASPQKTEP